LLCFLLFKAFQKRPGPTRCFENFSLQWKRVSTLQAVLVEEFTKRIQAELDKPTYEKLLPSIRDLADLTALQCNRSFTAAAAACKLTRRLIAETASFPRDAIKTILAQPFNVVLFPSSELPPPETRKRSRSRSRSPSSRSRRASSRSRDDRRSRDRHESGIEADAYAGRKFEDSDDDESDPDEKWSKNPRKKAKEERKKEPEKAAQDGNPWHPTKRCVVVEALGRKKDDNVSGGAVGNAGEKNSDSIMDEVFKLLQPTQKR
jgi:hypothetical protein